MQLVQIPGSRLKIDRSHKCGDIYAEYSIDKKFFLCTHCMVRRLYKELTNEWDRKEALRLCIEYLFLYTVIPDEHEAFVQDSLRGAFSDHPSLPGREDTEKRYIKESFDVEF